MQPYDARIVEGDGGQLREISVRQHPYDAAGGGFFFSGHSQVAFV